MVLFFLEKFPIVARGNHATVETRRGFEELNAITAEVK